MEAARVPVAMKEPTTALNQTKLLTVATTAEGLAVAVLPGGARTVRARCHWRFNPVSSVDGGMRRKSQVTWMLRMAAMFIERAQTFRHYSNTATHCIFLG